MSLVVVLLLPLSLEDTAVEHAARVLDEALVKQLRAAEDVELASAPDDVRFGPLFAAKEELAVAGETYHARCIIAGSAETLPGQEISVHLAVWDTKTGDRLLLVDERAKAAKAAELAPKLAEKITASLTELARAARAVIEPPKERKLEIVNKTTPGATAVTEPEKVRPKETSNPLARWMMIGGGSLALAGTAIGIGSYAAWSAPLNDAGVRTRAENEDLLGSARTGATVADIALIAGLAVAAGGFAAWLSGVGESVE